MKLCILRQALMATVAASAVIGAPAMAQTPMPWTGPYFGANLGYLGETSRANDIDEFLGGPRQTFTLSPSGITGGVQGGYNWQFNSFVVGIEGDLNATSASSSALHFGFMQQRTDLPAFATVRGRFGYAFSSAPLMIFGTGGVVFGDIRDSVNELSGSGISWKNSGWRTGWTAGGGGEWMFAPNWSLKVEALYLDLGSSTVTQQVFGLPYRFGFKDSAWLGRAGINFHF